MKRFKYLSMTAALLLLFVGLVFAAGNKSPMFSRHQPGGMFGVINETQTTGNIWFVDSGSATGADAAGYGENPDAPFLTIDYAIENCTASNGDWIIAMPGHVENISTESQIDIDVAGIRIIGLGTGRNRPVLTWTAKAGSIEVNAANCSIENIVLDMSFATGAHTGISVYTLATDFKFLNNEVIVSDDSTGKVGHGIYLTGGTRTQISNNNFLGSAQTNSAVTEVIFVGSRVDDVRINDNYFRVYVNSGTALYGGVVNGIGSKVSGFVMSDCTTILANTGSSPFNFERLHTDGLVYGVRSVGGTLTGTTIINPMKIQDFPNIKR